MKVTLYEICPSPYKISDYKFYDAGGIWGVGCGNGWVFSQVDKCMYRMSVTWSRWNFTLKEVIYCIFGPLDLIEKKYSRKKNVVPPMKNFLDECSVLFWLWTHCFFLGPCEIN